MLRSASLFLAIQFLLVSGVLADSVPPWVEVRKERFQSGFIEMFLPRKSIDPATTGVNAFANDRRFGTVRAQYAEVANTLRLKYVRVLFHWNDGVQASPSAQPFFGFYDEIARSLPEGVQAIVVLTGLPSWMKDSKNWTAGDPKRTFVEKWVTKVVARYSRNARIAGYEIWNEPNDVNNADNVLLGLSSSPEAYVSMLSAGYAAVKARSPRKLVISAATTPPNQNYPRNLSYNRKMQEAGVEAVCDVYGMHYYGKNYENVIRPTGVASFFRRIRKPIWVTESGAKGVNKQREYVERTWPFLKEHIRGISRFYYYQFTEATRADETYGLKNLTPGRTVSDLYIWLRDRR